MRKRTIALAAALLLPAATATAALLFGNAEHGGELHVAKCDGCHADRFAGDGTQIYLREDRRVGTIEGLMKQVEMCDTQLKIGLGETDIEDLVIYLNDTFYNFD